MNELFSSASYQSYFRGMGWTPSHLLLHYLFTIGVAGGLSIVVFRFLGTVRPSHTGELRRVAASFMVFLCAVCLNAWTTLYCLWSPNYGLLTISKLIMAVASFYFAFHIRSIGKQFMRHGHISNENEFLRGQLRKSHESNCLVQSEFDNQSIAFARLAAMHQTLANREDRISELKAEVNALLHESGAPPRYEYLISSESDSSRIAA